MITRTTLALAAAFPAVALAGKATVVLHNDARLARPAETIVIPFADVKNALPDVAFDQVIVRDDRGAIIPSRVTALKHIRLDHLSNIEVGAAGRADSR